MRNIVATHQRLLFPFLASSRFLFSQKKHSRPCFIGQARPQDWQFVGNRSQYPQGHSLHGFLVPSSIEDRPGCDNSVGRQVSPLRHSLIDKHIDFRAAARIAFSSSAVFEHVVSCAMNHAITFRGKNQTQRNRLGQRS